MNEEILMQALKKIDELSKKLEKYYDLLRVDNELDFVLKGTYLVDQDISNVLSGNY